MKKTFVVERQDRIEESLSITYCCMDEDDLHDTNTRREEEEV